MGAKTGPDAGRPRGCREENLDFIKTHFLPDLLRDLADIISGRRREWLPPDDIFLRSLESHLDWPVRLLSRYIFEHSNRSKPFDLRVQRWMSDQEWTFVRTPTEEWAKVVRQHGQDVGLRLGEPADILQAAAASRNCPASNCASVRQPADAVSAFELRRSARPSSEAATMNRC